MTNPTIPTVDGLQVNGSIHKGFEEILTQEALQFLKVLHINFAHRRDALLEERERRQIEIDKGILPDFLQKTAHIRQSDWKVAPLPVDLLDRRVEITGPVERKMIINALNSGAKVFMADFEDSNTPNWENAIQGQINLRDAINRTITFENKAKAKFYQLNEKTATLMVRPRGWHLPEKHITCNGEPMLGGLVDFGLFFFHNVKTLLNNGSGPYFYLPKLESHLEARLWNDVFVFAQDYMGIAQKTIKATVLVETIMASFELDEILFELKDHSAGLNCGRWDYIFSYIKKFKNLPEFLVPERGQVTMTSPFMKAYSQLVVKTCHKREVHAMGGMAAFIPVKNNPEENDKAIKKVTADKLLEVTNGHDGTWVAHPGLVKVAMDIFNEHMPTPNQISNKREDVKISAQDLVEVPQGTITEKGLRLNINVGILYIESWLRGNGAAAIYNLMEDAATAEISRTQVWQWLKRNSKMEDGRAITLELYEAFLLDEMKKIEEMVGKERFQKGRFQDAKNLFDKLVKQDDFIEFLTLPAYEMIN
jgi:malate synthase